MNRKWILLVAVPVLAAAVVVGAMLALSPGKPADQAPEAAGASRVKGRIAGLPAASAKPAGPAAASAPGEFTVKVARLSEALAALDKWSGQGAQAGGAPPPSAQVSELLGGTDWIAGDRAIVAKARLGANVMEAQILVPFANPSENFLAQAGKFATVTAGPDYYLLSYPPNTPVSPETTQGLVAASREVPKESFTLALSPASLMAAAKPMIDQQIAAMSPAPPAPGAPAPAQAQAQQLKDLAAQMEAAAAQVANLSLGLDLAGGNMKVALAAKPVEGTAFAEFLKKSGTGLAPSVLGDFKPQGFQSQFRTLPYDVEGFINWMGGIYSQMGLDLAAFAPVAKEMTGESVAAFSVSDGKISLEGMMALRKELAADDPFLESMAKAVFAYVKSMDDYLLKQEAKPPFLMGDLLVRLPDGKAEGLRTVGFRMRIPDIPPPAGQAAPAAKPFDEFQVRFTAVGNKLVAAASDEQLARLVTLARGLADRPAQGPQFAGTVDLGSMMSSMMAAMTPPGQAAPAMGKGVTLTFEAGFSPGEAWASYSLPLGGMMEMAKAAEAAAPAPAAVAEAPAAAPAAEVPAAVPPPETPAAVAVAPAPAPCPPGAVAVATPSPAPQAIPRTAPPAMAAPVDRSAAGEILRKADLAAVYGGNKAAARLYQKALEEDPENARARFGLALALADQGEYGKALEEVNKALEKDPKNANYLYGRARIHLLSGNKDAAKADFTLAAQAGSHDAQDWLARTQAG